LPSLLHDALDLFEGFPLEMKPFKVPTFFEEVRPIMIEASLTTASIVGVFTLTSFPKAEIGTKLVGTSSKMYLFSRLVGACMPL